MGLVSEAPAKILASGFNLATCTGANRTTLAKPRLKDQGTWSFLQELSFEVSLEAVTKGEPS